MCRVERLSGPVVDCPCESTVKLDCPTPTCPKREPYIKMDCPDRPNLTCPTLTCPNREPCPDCNRPVFNNDKVLCNRSFP